MKNRYSRHKRFISDVVRYTDPNIVSEISSYYVLLRSCSAFTNISDEQIVFITNKIVNSDITDVYKKLHKEGIGLSNQEIIFRIKRMKYIVNNKDGFVFKPTSILSDIGLMFNNSITIPYTEVRKMVDSAKEKVEKETNRKNKSKETIEWVLKNVNWKGRDGHSNKGTMDANEAEKILGISAFRIRAIIRQYYSDKPIPSSIPSVSDTSVSDESDELNQAKN